MFRHFLITLFNLALWDSDKTSAPTRTRAWLDSRVTLFERYCLPSVASQTCKNFVWLVMMDRDTPEDIVKRVEEWKRACPQLSPYFFSAEEVRGFTGRATGRRTDFIVNSIKDFLTPEDDLIITSNLDNDDAINQSFIEAIQTEVKNNPKERVISLVSGLQWFTGLNACLRMRYPHNHFLSLVESYPSDIKTVESMSHRMARRTYEVQDIVGKAMWIEVVHSGNVSNELRITSRIGYRPIVKALSLSDFGINLKFSAMEMLRGTLLLVPRFFGVGVKRLWRKLFRRG